jgi:hypothetical protein
MNSNMTIASCSEEEKDSRSSSSSRSYSEEDRIIDNKANFLNVGEGQHNNIFISGLMSRTALTPKQNTEGVYEAMLEKMEQDVQSFVNKGWKNQNVNRYKGFTFDHCIFDKSLIEEVADRLKVYRIALNPKTHFYECEFLTQRLKSYLQNKAEFKKKSTFLNSKERGKNGEEINISNSNK